MNVSVPSKVAVPGVRPPDGALVDDEQAAAPPSNSTRAISDRMQIRCGKMVAFARESRVGRVAAEGARPGLRELAGQHVVTADSEVSLKRSAFETGAHPPCASEGTGAPPGRALAPAW